MQRLNVTTRKEKKKLWGLLLLFFCPAWDYVVYTTRHYLLSGRGTGPVAKNRSYNAVGTYTTYVCMYVCIRVLVSISRYGIDT
ncbi:hypothetical protein GGS21DRAFT_518290 [Xylaria nigripes]|nr:hypothetical protein GGS21DRAFT_518290 [Xylaria nigripes]